VVVATVVAVFWMISVSLVFMLMFMFVLVLVIMTLVRMIVRMIMVTAAVPLFLFDHSVVLPTYCRIFGVRQNLVLIDSGIQTQSSFEAI
jgi:hypothetical protein